MAILYDYIDNPDYQKAYELYKKSAEQNNSIAQFLLGCMYHEGKGIKKDYVKTEFWYEKAAKQGFTKAQYALGKLYCDAQGVIQDYAKAREWFEKAAAQGNADAQKALNNIPVETWSQSIKRKALSWFRSN